MVVVTQKYRQFWFVTYSKNVKVPVEKNVEFVQLITDKIPHFPFPPKRMIRLINRDCVEQLCSVGLWTFGSKREENSPWSASCP